MFYYRKKQKSVTELVITGEDRVVKKLFLIFETFLFILIFILCVIVGCLLGKKYRIYYFELIFIFKILFKKIIYHLITRCRKCYIIS